MNKAILIIFHGKLQNGKIVDTGNDPCFDGLPTWGICRPLTRKSVNVGDTLIFIAKIEQEYILKGWFKIGDKIGYVTALRKFPNRQNIIISDKFSKRETKWRYKNLENHFMLINGHSTPDFLLSIQTTTEKFYQNETDLHQIDNWKCRRVFNCKSNQFVKCANENKCFKDGLSLEETQYKNYIIADENEWEDLDKFKITFKEIADAVNFLGKIKTPKGQHNILRFDQYLENFFIFLNQRKRTQINNIDNHLI